ncbi:MAG TPA: hypothetical protein DCX07_14800 [Phycisphaerales bacterium]|nr:hypothetical protein [Phycisphaerales bacterium]
MTANHPRTGLLQAGAAEADITPTTPQFLYGYPHVPRTSTGVHDPLWSSALFLSDGRTQLLLIANDLIFVSRETTLRVRRQLAEATGVPATNILMSATHTHSGPPTADMLVSSGDPVVPRTDREYLRFVEDRMVQAGTQAVRSAGPAEMASAVADAAGVGGNRRDPNGPSDPQVPVWVVRSAGGGNAIAAMLVCSMHPTVLHEDSTLVSADFPGFAKQYLRRQAVGDCPILYHTGPSGNQSPRHVVRANTFDEARRLGEQLGRAAERAIRGLTFRRDWPLACRGETVDLPRRQFPTLKQAQAKLRRAVETLERLRRQGAPREQVRTAECDWFGAEEGVVLARAARDGTLETVYRQCLPTEIQVMKLGEQFLVALPGELFVEYGLAIKACRTGTFVLSLANGELQGYIVTPEALAEGGYEATNSIFGPEAGQVLIQRATAILESL